MQEAFSDRNIAVLAISQEDKSVEDFAKIGDRLEFSPWYSILADVNYRDTKRYARTTAYLIDGQGVVRQVFPMETYVRASWWAVLGEIDRVRGKAGKEPGHSSP